MVISISTLVDPRHSVKIYFGRRVPTTFRVRNRQVRGETRILSIKSHSLIFLFSPKSECFNHLEMCSNRKGKIPLIASRREYLTYRPKHNISNSKELSTHFGIVDVSLPETLQCFIEPLFYVSQFIYDFYT